MNKLTSLAAAVALSASPLLADDVTDTLSSALQAYEDGDIEYAIEELDYAKSLLAAMQTQSLQKFLPEPMDGWTREIDEEAATGMAMFGGGAGTEAEYNNGSDYFTITILVDNPMIAAFGGMLSNASMLGMKVERIGREKFINQDGEMTGLIDGRILVQASGADTETMKAYLETIDYKALADFGR